VRNGLKFPSRYETLNEKLLRVAEKSKAEMTQKLIAESVAIHADGTDQKTRGCRQVKWLAGWVAAYDFDCSEPSSPQRYPQPVTWIFAACRVSLNGSRALIFSVPGF
jgi:hypothetical protein